VEITPVDPRDTQWEQPDPAFRVYFWDRPPASAEVDSSDVMSRSEEWRLAAAKDVRQVLAWAAGPAGRGRPFELFVEGQNNESPGLIRLVGTGLAGPGSD
jgi:hypothetical protein